MTAYHATHKDLVFEVRSVPHELLGTVWKLIINNEAGPERHAYAEDARGRAEEIAGVGLVWEEIGT